MSSGLVTIDTEMFVGVVGTITNVGYKITGANTSDPSGPYGNTLCSVDFVAYFDQLDTKTDPIDSDEDY